MIARRTNPAGWTPRVVVAAPVPRVRDYIIIEPAPASTRAMPQVHAIKHAVASHYGLQMSDMAAASRKYTVSHPRQLAMYLSRKLTDRSYPEIGRLFGGRDHTTVIHAIRQVEARMAKDQETRAVADAIIAQFVEDL